MSDNLNFVSSGGQDQTGQGIRDFNSNREHEQPCLHHTQLVEHSQQSSAKLPKSLDDDYDRLIRSFEAVGAIKGKVRQRFTLDKLAGYHGLPKAEFRALFLLWKAEGGDQR